MLPAIRNKAADDCQAHRLLLASSYWQAYGRQEVVAKQQKDPRRSIFQQRHASDVGELVYKHSKRYYYLSTYFFICITMAGVLVQAMLLITGYISQDTVEFNERERNIFMSLAVVLSMVFYLLSYALLSRTIIYIYYSEPARRFLGIRYSWCMARKNIEFKPGEVQLVQGPKNMWQVFRGGYIINKQRYHILTSDFTSPRHYNLMLGFLHP